LLPRGSLLLGTLRLLLLTDLLRALPLLLRRKLLNPLLWLLWLRRLSLLPWLLLSRLLSLLLLLLWLWLWLLLLRRGSLLPWLLLARLLSPLLVRLWLLSRLSLRLLLLLSRLLGPRLPLWLLIGLSAPVLGFVLMPACLRWLHLFLRALLLCGRRRCLLPVLMLFGLTLSFVLLVVLRERRGHRPEKQKQGSGAGNSNDLHSNRLP
jgi:hypothetical protein